MAENHNDPSLGDKAAPTLLTAECFAGHPLRGILTRMPAERKACVLITPIPPHSCWRGHQGLERKVPPQALCCTPCCTAGGQRGSGCLHPQPPASASTSGSSACTQHDSPHQAWGFVSQKNQKEIVPTSELRQEENCLRNAKRTGLVNSRTRNGAAPLPGCSRRSGAAHE